MINTQETNYNTIMNIDTITTTITDLAQQLTIKQMVYMDVCMDLLLLWVAAHIYIMYKIVQVGARVVHMYSHHGEEGVEA